MDRWRAMRDDDLPTVNRIADRVHPNFPESDAIPVERLALYPAGCLALEINGDVMGYAVSHPWRAGSPPSLDSLLGRLLDAPDTYYVHDLALLPEARGTGAAAQAVALLIAQAGHEGLPGITLIAVNNSAGFWQRHGFSVIGPAPASYGPDAAVMMR